MRFEMTAVAALLAATTASAFAADAERWLREVERQQSDFNVKR